MKTQTSAICELTACDAPVFAAGKCSRHYQQARRGTLGKPAKIAAKGQGTRVTVSMSRQLADAASAVAKAHKATRSAWIKRLIREALAAEIKRLPKAWAAANVGRVLE